MWAIKKNKKIKRRCVFFTEEVLAGGENPNKEKVFKEGGGVGSVGGESGGNEGNSGL